MADVPDTLVLARNRDLRGIGSDGIWVRRTVLTMLGLLSLAGLLNVFGQRSSTARADTSAATVSVYAPTRIRGGDFMEARFHVTAKRDLKKAILLLDPGWMEGMTVNTIEPAPVAEASADGRLSLDLGHIPAGRSFILFLQAQVDPTNVAWRRPQNVELLDGNTVVARVPHTITVFP